MKKVFLVVLIAFSFCKVRSKGSDLRRQVIASYFGNCPKKMYLPVIFGNFSIDQIGKNEYVTNGQFELKRDFLEGFKSKLLQNIRKKI